MGEFRKKIGMKSLQVIGFFLIVVLSLVLAGLLQYTLWNNQVKNSLQIYVQYAVYALLFLCLLVLVIYYIKKARTKSLSMYERGIILKKNKETIMYKDIRTFYFIPAADKKIKILLVEKSDGEKEVFKAAHVSEDFFDYFQKDYMLANADKCIEKIKAGQAMSFGILTGKQATFLRFIKNDSTIKNLTFEEEMSVSKEGLIYKGRTYPWNELKTEYDVESSNIVLTDGRGEEILVTYFSYVEKGELAFNLMDYFILNSGIEKEMEEIG